MQEGSVAARRLPNAGWNINTTVGAEKFSTKKAISAYQTKTPD